MLRVLLVVALALAACSGSGSAPPSAAASPAAAEPTTAASPAAASCSGRATPALTEGPYFKAGSPERTSLLEPGLAGTSLRLTGHVYSVGCRPQAGAVLDFWQADSAGRYDNAGYRLRGHQAADAGGGFSLETIIPGLYPGRTEHIHVKVTPPGGPTLTTQLFFPGVAGNAQDSIFDPALLVTLSDAATGKSASFDFVVG